MKKEIFYQGGAINLFLQVKEIEAIPGYRNWNIWAEAVIKGGVIADIKPVWFQNGSHHNDIEHKANADVVFMHPRWGETEEQEYMDVRDHKEHLLPLINQAFPITDLINAVNRFRDLTIAEQQNRIRGANYQIKSAEEEAEKKIKGMFE